MLNVRMSLFDSYPQEFCLGIFAMPFALYFLFWGGLLMIPFWLVFVPYKLFKNAKWIYSLIFEPKLKAAMQEGDSFDSVSYELDFSVTDY